jgi:hypothetical protein
MPADSEKHLLGHVSDEYYAALCDVVVELNVPGGPSCVVRSTPSGAVYAALPPGPCEAVLAKPGYGSKRVNFEIDPARPHAFRLLSDTMQGYAWPKWCRGGEEVEFRVHSVEAYKLELWRYRFQRQYVRNVGWFDNHGPRAVMQTVPDGHFAESGVQWHAGSGTVHRQVIDAPAESGLYCFHARGESGQRCSFPLVVAPRQSRAPLAVLASTNTWNAYNPFGGRSNYIMAEGMLPRPIVNARSDLPRYSLAQYGEWDAHDFEPLSFDRPEPENQIPFDDECTDPIEGRTACHLAAAEWRLHAWLQREGFEFDLYADAQLHDGTLDLDAYRALVLSVHPEYWSRPMYRRVKDWVFERGGRLIYLGGNGINCEVEFLPDDRLRFLNHWDHRLESRFHTSYESEANLLGVVYSDPGAMTVAPYVVERPEHWVFDGTGLRAGDHFGKKTLHERYGDGASGHETDKTSPSSPANVIRLARGLNSDEGGAHLVYFTTPGQGEVFSAGSITYATALLCDEATSRITHNVVRRFLRA